MSINIALIKKSILKKTALSLFSFGLSLCLMTPATTVLAADSISGLKSPDDSVRIKAVDELGSQKEKAADAVDQLTDMLKDNSAMVRARTCRLGRGWRKC